MSLILNRRPGEALIIGDAIKIKVIRVAGKQVTFAIEAPREIVIDRVEIYVKKHVEQLKKLTMQAKGV